MRGERRVRVLSPGLGWTLPIVSGGLRYEAMTAAVLAESAAALVALPRRRGTSPLPGHVVWMPLPLSRWPSIAGAIATPWLVWLAARSRPAAIRVSSVAHFGLAALVAVHACRWLRCRVSLVANVLHVEEDGSVDSGRGRFGRRIDAAVLRRCDRVTVPSRATAAAVAHLLRTPDIPVLVVPPCLPSPIASPRAGTGTGSRPLRLLFVGRLKDRKRPLDFAHTCALVARARPIEVIVVGKGPLLDQMRAALDGVPTSFRHALPDLQPVYEWADVLVCTSFVEGFYFVGLEAMAAGTALVAYDVPAIRELTGDGRCARLVPAGDITGLATAILDLDDRQLARLAADGRDRAGCYSPEQFRAAVESALLAPVG
jgi:glycosyltransferase involved in cell wall biosynthesis